MELNLNLFSYKALETKIANAKPKELKVIAEELVDKPYRHYTEKIAENLEHYIYCLKGVVLATETLKKKSKLKPTKGLLNAYDSALIKVSSALKLVNNIDELKIDSIKDIFKFNTYYIMFSISVLEDIKTLEKLYFKYFNDVPPEEFNISIALKYISYEIRSSDRKTIVKKYIDLNCSKEFQESGVIDVRNSSIIPDETIKNFNDINNILTLIKKEQDEIQSTTN